MTHVFAAFDSGGAPAAGVTAHRSGKCFTSSITVSARDAYRCLAGSQLFDPCFAAGTAPLARTVDCYESPWSGAVEVRLRTALPAPDAPLKIAQPWAIQLAGGDRCVVTTGTTQLVRGVAMRYQCGAGTAGLTSSATGTNMLLEALFLPTTGPAHRVAVTASWTA